MVVSRAAILFLGLTPAQTRTRKVSDLSTPLFPLHLASTAATLSFTAAAVRIILVRRYEDPSQRRAGYRVCSTTSRRWTVGPGLSWSYVRV